MKNIFTLILIVVFSLNINAQTSVSGEQSGTWTVANSPYNVTDTVTVPSGQTLTIEPGVVVNFQGHYKIRVNGNLQAIGTETDSIIFTAENHSAGWDGMTIETSETSVFSYCKFEYGITESDSNYPEMHGGAIRLMSSDAVFSHCVFSNNDSSPSEGMGGAIYGINTSSSSGDKTSFTDCKFIENKAYSEGGAVKFSSDLGTQFIECEFIENTTSYGGGAVMCYSVIGTTFIQCLFANNSSTYSNGGAIETLGNGNELYFKNCTMVGNNAVSGSGGALALYYGTADFVNCIVYDNTSQYDDDNVYIDAGTGSATVNYCNMIMPDYNTTGTNNIQTNPLFVDADNGNFHLQETSPCIDAGTDIGLSYFGTAPDMGCYEYNPNAGIRDSYTDKINIYPNPADNFFFIENQNNIKSITISDISGKIVKKPVINNNQIKVDVSNLTKGIYLITIKTDNKTLTEKMLKH